MEFSLTWFNFDDYELSFYTNTIIPLPLFIFYGIKKKKNSFRGEPLLPNFKNHCGYEALIGQNGVAVPIPLTPPLLKSQFYFLHRKFGYLS